MKTPTGIKIQSVDMLRGVAIILVVTYHIFCPLYGYCLPWEGWLRDFQSPPTSSFAWIYPITFGWSGVALFFVLSGFCIHLSYLKSANFKISHFFGGAFGASILPIWLLCWYLSSLTEIIFPKMRKIYKYGLMFF